MANNLEKFARPAKKAEIEKEILEGILEFEAMDDYDESYQDLVNYLLGGFPFKQAEEMSACCSLN